MTARIVLASFSRVVVLVSRPFNSFILLLLKLSIRSSSQSSCFVECFELQLNPKKRNSFAFLNWWTWKWSTVSLTLPNREEKDTLEIKVCDYHEAEDPEIILSSFHLPSVKGTEYT